MGITNIMIILYNTLSWVMSFLEVADVLSHCPLISFSPLSNECRISDEI